MTARSEPEPDRRSTRSELVRRGHVGRRGGNDRYRPAAAAVRGELVLEMAHGRGVIARPGLGWTLNAGRVTLAETAMAERVKQAASDLRASGRTMFAS